MKIRIYKRNGKYLYYAIPSHWYGDFFNGMYKAPQFLVANRCNRIVPLTK